MLAELKNSLNIVINLLVNFRDRCDSSLEITLLNFHVASLEEVRVRLRKEACSREAFLKAKLAQDFLWHLITRKLFEDMVADAAEAVTYQSSEGPLRRLKTEDLNAVFKRKQ